MSPNTTPAPTKRLKSRLGDVVMLLAFAASLFYWTGLSRDVVTAFLPAGRFDLRLLGVKLQYDVRRR